MPKTQVSERRYSDDLIKNIRISGKKYYIDPIYNEVGGKEVEHWNTALSVISYVLDANQLSVGEPGFAKTTGAKVICSIMSGYPFDLYEAAQIQGHPDQTFETMIARPDFSKLAKEESVIWLASAYLPVRIIDEINRLSSGHQDGWLNILETGRINYLNATFFTGTTPCYATANHPDDGNHVLIPPLRDRFLAHIECGYIGATYRQNIRQAIQNIDDLKDEKLTTEIMDIVNDKNLEIKERLRKIELAQNSYLSKKYKETGAVLFDAETKKRARQEIENVNLSTDADTFLMMIDSELNFTPTFGRKRSFPNDSIDSSNHAKKLASTKTKNAFSPRGSTKGLENYAKALAYLMGDEKVEKHHLESVAPHILGHRLEFTEEFRAQHQADIRGGGMFGDTLEMHLSKELIKDVETNYEKAKGDVDLLLVAYKNEMNAYRPDEDRVELSTEQKRRVTKLLEDPNKVDHPLVREYATRIARARKKRR
ncbi:AAA family ATPase [Candidatus Woesearchaeota archaeon]|nr:AAA family ATPase [Candidatus Woesearchaeota archaeon]